MSRNDKINQFDKIIKIMEISQKIISFGLSGKCEGKLRPFTILFPSILGLLTVTCIVWTIKDSINSGKNIKSFGVAILIGIGIFQTTSKNFYVLLYERKIDSILRWIGKLHSVPKNENNSLFTSHMQHAEKNVSLFVRILLYSFGLALLVLFIYMSMEEKLLFVFPILPKNYFVIHTIGASVVLSFDIVNYTISESMIICIGIYFIAALNILSDLICSLSESSTSNNSSSQTTNSTLQEIITLHIEILSKFREFCDIFDIIFAIQLFSSVLLLLFNLLHSHVCFD
uniref:Uncharacterized protein n=1 Tax=Lutzomyia longipalpis TaxID=7200 RepID=A0A905HRQ7_LUTLO